MVLCADITHPVLTAGLDVTQVHPDLGVQREAPGPLHLAPGVPAEVVAAPELGVVLGQVVAVGVLGAPRLAVVARRRDAQRAAVVGPAAVVAAVVHGRVCWAETGLNYAKLTTTTTEDDFECNTSIFYS